jgi:hypothetical protein
MDKKKLLIALGILLFLFIVLVAGTLYFIRTLEDTQEKPEDNPFGDTTGERDPNTVGTLSDDIFGTGGLTEKTTIEEGITLENGEVFRLVTDAPVIGATPFLHTRTDRSATPWVRYTHHLSGNLYEIPLGVTTDPVLLSDQTVLRVAEALWSRTASSTLMRFFDTENERVSAFLGTFAYPPQDASSTPTEEVALTYTGRPLTNGILRASFAPNTNSIAYLLPEEGGSQLYIENMETGSQRAVWSSPLSGLSIQWSTPNRITAYTNPSDTLAGAVWLIDPGTNKTELVMSNKQALSALLDPTGSRLLYSFREDSGSVYSLRIHTLGGQEDVYLPLPTISEKCVWGRANTSYVYCAVPRNINQENFITNWYQGKFFSDDVLWRFEASTGVAKRLLSPTDAIQTPLDMLDLAVDPTDTYLIFRDKANNRLWSLELPQEVVTPEEPTTASSTTQE